MFLDFDLVNGLRFQGPEGVPRIRVGGKFDLTAHIYDDRNRKDSEVRFEESELRLEGDALGRTWLRVVADLDGRSTRDGLSEATLAGGRPRVARATAGLQQIPLGIEASIPDDELAFTGPAFSSWLIERTDLSLRVDGELLAGFLCYDGGYSAGEGFDVDAGRVDDPRVAMRLVLYPLTADVFIPEIRGSLGFLSGLYLSSSFAYESSYRRAIEIETHYRNRLFQTVPMRADQATWWHYGWGLDGGRVRLIQEWALGRLEDVETAGGSEDLSRPVTTMSASLTVRILGDPEPYDSHPYRERSDVSAADWSAPGGERPAVPELRFPGVVEVGLRYADGDVDGRIFSLGLADPATSSEEFRTITASVSLRPSRTLRLIAECVRTIADPPPAAFESDGRDTSFAFRIELIF